MDIDKKLEEVRSKAASFGRLYGQKETSDDFLKITYASLYEDVPNHLGTVAEKDAWVRRQSEFIDATERKRDAYADFKTAETYLKLLLAEVEVWRTQCANDRYVDKLHT